jgi:hypothetical protein
MLVRVRASISVVPLYEHKSLFHSHFSIARIAEPQSPQGLKPELDEVPERQG